MSRKIKPSDGVIRFSRSDMIAFNIPNRVLPREPEDIGIINVKHLDDSVAYIPNVTNTRHDQKMERLRGKYGLLLG